MKYIIDDNDNLIVNNDSFLTILMFNKFNRWIKWEYDQNGNEIYYEDDDGNKYYEDV